MTEWPATIDSRCHDAVIFDLDCVIAETAADAVEVLDSTVLLLRRLRDLGIATAVYSSSQDCAQVLRGAGIDEFGSILVDKGIAGKLGPAVLAETASRLRVSAGRCVIIARNQAAVRTAATAASASSLV